MQYQELKAMNNIFSKIITYILLFGLFYSCSNIMMPSGGPKDEKPPVLLKAKPENYSKHFNSKKIDLFFDEYVTLKDVQKKLLISPPLKNNPEIILYGKKISFEIKDTLKLNTTYTFNFSDAIVDNNESNPIPEFKYVFSTGNSIDSIELSGKVTDAFTNAPAEGVFVCLYLNKNDSAPYSEIPYYVAKTNKDGYFNFTNLKLDTFRIFALKDINLNYKYDSEKELIGFSDSLIIFHLSEKEITDSIQPDSIVKSKKILYDAGEKELVIFNETSKRQYLKTIDRTLKQRLLFIFNLPMIDTPIIKPLYCTYDSNWFVPEYFHNNDSLVYWLTDTTLINVDTITFAVKYKTFFGTDSFNVKTDTLFSRLKAKTEKTIKRGKKENNEIAEKIPSLNITLNTKNIEKNLNSSLLFISETPIKYVDTSKISLFNIKDSVEKNIKFKFKKEDMRNFSVYYKWEENNQYKIIVEPKAFTDMYNINNNDTLQLQFNTPKRENFGTLKLNIKNSFCPYIIQLLTEKENVERQYFSNKDETIKFEFIGPSTYLLKIIFDTNNNKKWDTGNYLKHIQPEKVIYYNEKITIRANWDLEIDWDLNKTK
jgi:hypothetical protein